MMVYWGVEFKLHAFLTLALGGLSGQLHALAALSPSKEAGWALEPIWTPR
jgi:hypothetical protein